VSERSEYTDGRATAGEADVNELGARAALHVGRTISWRELWAQTAERVGSRPMAQWLCATASGFDGDEWREALDRPVTHRAVAHLDAMLRRLDAGEPLQYVLGSWAFRHIDLMVDRRVLIPRPETEEVAGVAVDLAAAHGAPVRCADLGTGSGAIGLSMAFELATHSPRIDAEVWITDVSIDALDVARANIAGLGRGAPTVRVAHGSWFDALPHDLRGRLDVVVANPPYVEDGDSSVEDIVAAWEPHVALYGGDDGLDHIRTITAAAPSWLSPGGWLVLEIGAGQGSAVARLLAGAGLTEVEIRRDAARRDRIAVARRARS